MRIFAFLTGLLILVAGCSGGRTLSGPSAADIRKADYIFLEGQRHQMSGNRDAYHELISYAHSLNPDDKFVGYEYGYSLLGLSEGDSATVIDGYKLIADYADNNPDDYYSNFLYASLTSHIGEIEKAVKIWERLHNHYPAESEITARYAEILGSQKDSAATAHALALYDTLAVSEGQSIQIAARKIQVYYNLGDTAAMLSEALGVQQANPLSVENNVFAGDIYASFNRRDSALTFYDRAVELDPSSGLAYYARANFYRAAGDTAAYDREVYNALIQESLDVEPKMDMLTEYARRLFSDSTQHARIDELFRKLIDIHPHEAELRLRYREYLLAVDDMEGAAEQTSYALDIDPSDEKLWIALAALRLNMDDYEGSLADIKRALHYFPQQPTLRLIEAADLQQLERFDEALAATAEGIAAICNNDPEQLSSLLTTRGDIFYAMQQTDSAFVYYDMAINLDPENTTAKNNAAYYLAVENRDLDRAETLILQALDENPDQPTTLDTYAWVLFRKGDYEAARQVIDRALELDPEPSAEELEHAGDIYFMLDELDQALAFWLQALDDEPDNEQLKTKIKNKHI